MMNNTTIIFLVIMLSIIVIADFIFLLFPLFIIILVIFVCDNFKFIKKYKIANNEIMYKIENIVNMLYFNIVTENIIAAVNDTDVIDIIVFNNPKMFDDVKEYKVINPGLIESCSLAGVKDTRERFLTKALRPFFMRDSQPVEAWG